MLIFMPSQLCLWKRLFIAAGLFLSVNASLASNLQLRLQCQLFAGGEDYQFVVVPTAHPYTAKPMDLERFRFKAKISKSQSLTALLGKPSFFNNLLICHRLPRTKA
jgi:hypothetical protein